MSSSIDLKKFEELNEEYEKIYNNFFKKIEKLEKKEDEQQQKSFIVKKTKTGPQKQP